MEAYPSLVPVPERAGTFFVGFAHRCEKGQSDELMASLTMPLPLGTPGTGAAGRPLPRAPRCGAGPR